VLWFALPSSVRVPALAVAVARFSAVAFVSVLGVAAGGIGEAVDHLPVLDALWRTSYGKAILVKTGVFGFALVLASGNLLRSRPGLIASDREPEHRQGASRLLHRLASGEAVLVGGIIFAAAVLSSLAPPPPAYALQDRALAKVGPGTVSRTVTRAGYKLELVVTPNRAAAPDVFTLRVTRNGQPVTNASATLTFAMTTMEMPNEEYQLTEIHPGVYRRAAPALVMVGVWGLTFHVAPRTGPPLSVLILDEANG
jgi:copper transport protein